MLTQQDKDWILNTLKKMIPQTPRIPPIPQVPRDEPQLRGLLSAQEKQLRGMLALHEEHVSGILALQEKQILARLEATEIRLVNEFRTEFNKWASPVEMRQRTHAAALRAIDAEMEAFEDRVKTLENPKPFPG